MPSHREPMLPLEQQRRHVANLAAHPFHPRPGGKLSDTTHLLGKCEITLLSHRHGPLNVSHAL